MHTNSCQAIYNINKPSRTIWPCKKKTHPPRGKQSLSWGYHYSSDSWMQRSSIENLPGIWSSDWNMGIHFEGGPIPEIFKGQLPASRDGTRIDKPRTKLEHLMLLCKKALLEDFLNGWHTQMIGFQLRTTWIIFLGGLRKTSIHEYTWLYRCWLINHLVWITVLILGSPLTVNHQSWVKIEHYQPSLTINRC